MSPTRRLSADLATLHRNPLEYNSLPASSARRQHRRKQHDHQQQQQHRRRSEQNLSSDLPEFKQGNSSSSSEDARAASEDRLLAPPRPWSELSGQRPELLPDQSCWKKSSVGGRRKMREEQRRIETSRKNSSLGRDIKRVSASVPRTSDVA